MAGYQPLTSDEVHDAAKAYFDERKDKSQSLVEPLHILVEGQPGAGKTQASFLARGELAQQGVSFMSMPTGCENKFLWVAPNPHLSRRRLTQDDL